MPKPTPAQAQMNAIISDLQTLVPNTLNCVLADDMTKVSIFDRVYPGFPAAVVMTPMLKTSDYEDQADNLRQYTWGILVVTTPSNLPSNDPTYLAGLVDNVSAVFDLDSTLQGTANGGLLPAVLEPPGVISANSITYVVFTMTLIAKQLVPAGVQ
jgi:hypothetical protein